MMRVDIETADRVDDYLVNSYLDICYLLEDYAEGEVKYLEIDGAVYKYDDESWIDDDYYCTVGNDEHYDIEQDVGTGDLLIDRLFSKDLWYYKRVYNKC